MHLPKPCNNTLFLGMAWAGVICGYHSQSIVQDGYNFIIITVAAHELGHR